MTRKNLGTLTLTIAGIAVAAVSSADAFAMAPSRAQQREAEAEVRRIERHRNDVPLRERADVISDRPPSNLRPIAELTELEKQAIENALRSPEYVELREERSRGLSRIIGFVDDDTDGLKIWVHSVEEDQPTYFGLQFVLHR